MSSPSLRLTSTGKLVLNLAFAILAFLAADALPPHDYKWLVALVGLAVFASLLGSISLRRAAPGQATTREKGGTADLLGGSIKWFNGTKGFGFITGDDGTEVFVHFKQIEGLGKRSIKPGQRVTYRVADSDRGPQAEEVKPA